MRIGIDASFLRKPGTGIGQVTLYLLKTLIETEQGRQHDFFLYCEEGVKLPFELPENFHKRDFLPWWKRDDVFRKWLWEQRLAREARYDDVEIFLSLYQSTSVFPENIYHVMVVHDIIPRLFPQYQGNIRQKWYWQGVERALRHVKNIIAVSEATKNDLVEFGIPHESITVISPDAAPIFRRELLAGESIRVMEHYALTPGYIYHGGGLEVRKNTESLLRAYQLLVEKEKMSLLTIPLPMLLISGKIFAESNSLATPVKSLVKELDLGKRVRLLDFVPENDLPALYHNALFFVYPSLYEGFGLPVLEALCMKIPVLTSDNSSLPEVAGDAALYIDATSVTSLASGMERMLCDAALRHTLCEKALEATARFSWESFVGGVWNVLIKK